MRCRRAASKSIPAPPPPATGEPPVGFRTMPYRTLCAIATAVVVSGCHSDAAADIVDTFTGTSGLIAAEHSPAEGDLLWQVTSGSLYRDHNEGWTGVPDDGLGDGATGSAVFRMVSARRDLGDVEMTMRLKVDDLVETPRTPAEPWDGAHIWVRYESAHQLYAIAVDRRDSTMIIKKKCAGGEVNGGTYFDLSRYVPDIPIPFGRWQQVRVEVRDTSEGAVAISVNRDGHVVQAVDHGTGCPPLRTGGIGLRGDNAELRFDDIRIVSLDGTTQRVQP